MTGPMGDQTHKVHDPQGLNDRLGPVTDYAR